MKLRKLRTNQDYFMQRLFSQYVFLETVLISIPLFARTKTHETNKLKGIIILAYMTGKYKRKFDLVK